MSEVHSHFDGLSSLISFAGFSIPARARFVAQFVGSTLFSTITIGLVAGQAGALLPCGPLLPYMTGSWLGYTLSCVGFWKRSKGKAVACARRYPKVLAHSLLANLDVEVPADLDMNENRDGRGVEGKQTLEYWIQSGGMGRLSYAILAAQGCEEDIAEMQKSERQRLIDEYSRKD